jgi:prephenate dehydrogenase
MSNTPYKHIAIIGTGLIGGSIARIIRHQFPSITITGISRRQSAIDQAVSDGIIDSGYTALSQLPENIDLAFVCTPIASIPGHTEMLFHRGIPVVTDIGSTKTAIAHNSQCQAKNDSQIFIPGHPMAGNEFTGFEHSRRELIEGCNYILCPPKETNLAYDIFAEFLKTLKFNVIELSPEKHDQLAALASHIPYFMACTTLAIAQSLVPPEDVEVFSTIISTGFKSTTRVASSDPAWGQDIASTNPLPLIDGLQKAQDILAQLSQSIQDSDSPGLGQYLSEIKGFNDQLRHS